MERLDPLTDNSGRERMGRRSVSSRFGYLRQQAEPICLPLAGVRSTPVCYLNAGNPEEVIEPGFHRLDGGEVDKARGLQ